jgi:hypothetical protein
MKSLIHISRPYDLPYATGPVAGIHPHVDLRLNPGAIHQIPELRGEPLLKDLVEVLNAAGNPFMTHGVAKGYRRPFDPGGDIPVSLESGQASAWCTSYVTFSYWDMERNKPGSYENLHDRFALDAIGTEVCFVVQSAYFLTRWERSVGRKWGDTNATVCLVWASGWSENPAVAQSRWRNVVKTLKEFFIEEQKAAAPVPRVTVSQHFLIAEYFKPDACDET